MESPSRLLVCGRYRPWHLCEGQGSWPRQRASGKPQSTLCTSHPSYPEDRRRDPGDRRSGLAATTDYCLIKSAIVRRIGLGPALNMLLLVLDLLGTFVFA